MKISELIAELQVEMQEYGDIRVAVYNKASQYDPDVTLQVQSLKPRYGILVTDECHDYDGVMANVAAEQVLTLE